MTYKETEINGVKYKLVPVDEFKRMSKRTNWHEVFEQIEPGMAAVMDLTPKRVKACRASLAKGKAKGLYQDYYTFVKDRLLHVAREPADPAQLRLAEQQTVKKK